jgi:hypothetical protein
VVKAAEETEAVKKAVEEAMAVKAAEEATVAKKAAEKAVVVKEAVAVKKATEEAMMAKVVEEVAAVKAPEEAATKATTEEAMTVKAAAEAATVVGPISFGGGGLDVVRPDARGLLSRRQTRKRWVKGKPPRQGQEAPHLHTRKLFSGSRWYAMHLMQFSLFPSHSSPRFSNTCLYVVGRST